MSGDFEIGSDDLMDRGRNGYFFGEVCVSFIDIEI